MMMDVFYPTPEACGPNNNQACADRLGAATDLDGELGWKGVGWGQGASVRRAKCAARLRRGGGS
jgi:hypothetical protein